MIVTFEPRTGSSRFCVSVSDKDEEVARLERLNQDLKRSLRRCRDMLHDYEVRLTANSNDPVSTGTGETDKRDEA